MYRREVCKSCWWAFGLLNEMTCLVNAAFRLGQAELEGVQPTTNMHGDRCTDLFRHFFDLHEGDGERENKERELLW